jgi:hypothetical protein
MRRTDGRLGPLALAAVDAGTMAAMLGGCSAATSPGSHYRLTEPRPWGPTTVQWLTACSPNPDVGSIHSNVVLTGDPTDEKAWHFEARVRVLSTIGVPYGRERVDYLVAGFRAHCETARGALRSKPHAFYSQETPPTEPCKGPLYFRREGPTSSTGEPR